MNRLAYQPTPIQHFSNRTTDEAGIKLLIKREDLNHPLVSGNKWWKLKYNLQEALRLQKKTLLTFGGAYSNHIYATAAAAKELDLGSIGIIRGEKTLPLNKTLAFAREMGMQLHYISREVYRKKEEESFLQKLRDQLGDHYLIPEGGTNKLAVQGCAEFADELAREKFDYICLAVGTGGTIAGLACGLSPAVKIIGIPVLKDGEFLYDEIKNLIQMYAGRSADNWSLFTSYHHGGYAKFTDDLLKFIQGMKRHHNLPLDHVYTGKLLWAVLKEIEKGTFKRGSTILALHTGGLQGSVITGT